MERNFLIVAADAKVREALAARIRAKGFTVTLAENGTEAARVAQTVSVRSVLIESHLRDMSAVELRRRILEARPETRVLIVTSYGLLRNTPELFRYDASDYVLDGDQLFDLVDGPPGVIEGPTPSGWDQGTRALVQVVDVLVGLLEIEYRHFASSSHQAMLLARATAEEMGANEDLVREVVLGSLLRDVGRAGDTVGSVDGEDDTIRDHVAASVRLLEHIEIPWKVLPVIRHHHERYDGSGAPDGLRGREIPMGSRIVAVVDAYVSLTAGPREKSTDPDSALRDLVRRAGHEFDPEVVEAFQRVIDKRLGGRQSRAKPVLLIIGPEDEFRRLLKMRLIHEGLDVEQVPSYHGFHDELPDTPPDLLLVDIDADPAEAFVLLHEMQHDERLCRTPVVFVSQFNDRLLRLRSLRQGVDDFIYKNADMEETVARLESILVRQAIRLDWESSRHRRGISGDLENLSLPEIIQTLMIGMKTACVTLISGDRVGRIWLENGAARHAETDGQQGEGAFYEMVRWLTGEFVIEHGVRADDATLSHDAMFLLMEGLRLMDEAAGAGPLAAS